MKSLHLLKVGRWPEMQPLIHLFQPSQRLKETIRQYFENRQKQTNRQKQISTSHAQTVEQNSNQSSKEQMVLSIRNPIQCA